MHAHLACGGPNAVFGPGSADGSAVASRILLLKIVTYRDASCVVACTPHGPALSFSGR